MKTEIYTNGNIFIKSLSKIDQSFDFYKWVKNTKYINNENNDFAEIIKSFILKQQHVITNTNDENRIINGSYAKPYMNNKNLNNIMAIINFDDYIKKYYHTLEQFINKEFVNNIGESLHVYKMNEWPYWKAFNKLYTNMFRHTKKFDSNSNTGLLNIIGPHYNTYWLSPLNMIDLSIINNNNCYPITNNTVAYKKLSDDLLNLPIQFMLVRNYTEQTQIKLTKKFVKKVNKIMNKTVKLYNQYEAKANLYNPNETNLAKSKFNL